MRFPSRKFTTMPILRVVALTLATLFLGTGVAQAVSPQFDNGSEINLDDIYTNAQLLTNIFQDTGVYGKLTAAADVYKFVPEQDGEQTLSLIGHAGVNTQPFLVLVDPTDATEARPLGIPLPGEEYHTAVIKPIDGLQTYSEPVLFERYTLFAQERLSFKKDVTYYLIVFDPTRELSRYAIKFGDGKIWGAGDFFTSFNSWWALKTDRYGGTDPFDATSATFGSILFFLAFAFLLGIWMVEETFAFLSGRSKMAGYLLIKLQKYSRVMVWVALWFTALGGYIYFDPKGWPGIPFVLALLFLGITALFLVRTLILSPKLMQLEVSKQEAVIPTSLRKQLYLMLVLTGLGMGTFLTLLTLQFS